MFKQASDVVERRLRWLWWSAGGVTVALWGLAMLTSGTSAGATVYLVVALLLAIGFMAVVGCRSLQPRAAWNTLALGLGLMALGDVFYTAPPTGGAGGPALNPVDVLYLASSVALVVGALRLKGAHAGERERAALIDATSIALAAGVLLWRPLLEPRLSDAGGPVLTRLVSGSFSVFDVVVVAMMLWLLLGARRWTTATVLLLAASVANLGADLVYSYRFDQGTLGDGSLAWLDTAWLIAYGLFFLAALHPSAREVSVTSPGGDRTISGGRLVLSGVTLLGPVIALGVWGTDSRHLVVALVVETALVVLVLVRLAELAAGERRARRALADRERYFRSLVENASEAMVVVDDRGLTSDASPAVLPLLGLAPDELIGHRPGAVVPGLEREVLDALLATSMGTPDEVITGEVSIVEGSERRWLEVRTANMLAEPAVKGIVVNLHDVTDRRQLQDDLERRAFTDPLTSLANRVVFFDRLAQLLQRRDPPEVAVVYCDLDRFKEVNDRYGHSEGDRLLQAVAVRLSSAVRSEDTLARLGGDEFAVLVHGPGAARKAAEVAQRIVNGVRRSSAATGLPSSVTMSVGLACSAEVGRDPSIIVGAADDAMYRAKRAGGDRVLVGGGRTASSPSPSPTPSASASPSSSAPRVIEGVRPEVR